MLVKFCNLQYKNKFFSHYAEIFKTTVLELTEGNCKLIFVPPAEAWRFTKICGAVEYAQ